MWVKPKTLIKNQEMLKEKQIKEFLKTFSKNRNQDLIKNLTKVKQ